MGSGQIKATKSNSTNYQMALAHFFAVADACEHAKGEGHLLLDPVREAIVTAARELAHYNEHYKTSREMCKEGPFGDLLKLVDYDAVRSEVMRKLGATTSEARAAASAANGKKGGRPVGSGKKKGKPE